MNVVVLMTDQQAHNMLGCAGGSMLQTPTYDRLAADGTRFTQATCATTPCLPSRHNLFFGLHAFQTGIYQNQHLIDPPVIPPWSFMRVFSELGYTTGACGKMHLFPYEADFPRGPYLGFDYRAGHFYETCEAMDTYFGKEHPDLRDKLHAEKREQGMSRDGDRNLADFVGYDSALESRQFPDWWSCQKAVEFIERHGDNPFALVVSLIRPHAPHVVPADMAGLYRPGDVPLPGDAPDGLTPQWVKGGTREELARAVSRYMAAVTFTDACHGEVIRKLNETGLYDETLIIFCSDHGELLGSRGPCTFSKMSLYEQAIRVPLILKPPKSMLPFKPGAVYDDPVSLVDVLPTIHRLAGIERNYGLPGIDLGPALRGETSVDGRGVTLTEFAMRHVSTAVRTADMKLILHADGREEELYDLRKDPREFENLAGGPEGRLCAEEMKDLLLGEIGRINSRRIPALRGHATKEWSQMQDV